MNVKIATFNQPGLDGRIRLADSKEYIVELLNKLDFCFLTDGRMTREENLIKSSCIDITSIIAKIENICIIENGIGYADKHIFDVYGDINFIKKAPAKLIKATFENNIVAVGIRALGTSKKDQNNICLEISKIICWDIIILDKKGNK